MINVIGGLGWIIIYYENNFEVVAVLIIFEIKQNYQNLILTKKKKIQEWSMIDFDIKNKIFYTNDLYERYERIIVYTFFISIIY